MKTDDRPLGMLTIVGPDGEPAEVDPTDDIGISEDISEEMRVQPGLYAWYAGCSERALARVKKLQYRIHCLREDMDVAIRAKENRPSTEKAIDREINRHPKMRKLFESYIEAKAVYGQLAALTKAFEQRAFMLQSVGANWRAQGIEVHTLRAKTQSAMKRK